MDLKTLLFTAEMSRLVVPIKSFVQSDLVVDPEFSSEQFTMSLNKSTIAPVPGNSKRQKWFT
jgi:hypothetical protein